MSGFSYLLAVLFIFPSTSAQDEVEVVGLYIQKCHGLVAFIYTFLQRTALSFIRDSK